MDQTKIYLLTKHVEYNNPGKDWLNKLIQNIHPILSIETMIHIANNQASMTWYWSTSTSIMSMN